MSINELCKMWFPKKIIRKLETETGLLRLHRVILKSPTSRTFNFGMIIQTLQLSSGSTVVEPLYAFRTFKIWAVYRKMATSLLSVIQFGGKIFGD